MFKVVVQKSLDINQKWISTFIVCIVINETAIDYNCNYNYNSKLLFISSLFSEINFTP